MSDFLTTFFSYWCLTVAIFLVVQIMFYMTAKPHAYGHGRPGEQGLAGRGVRAVSMRPLVDGHVLASAKDVHEDVPLSKPDRLVFAPAFQNQTIGPKMVYFRTRLDIHTEQTFEVVLRVLCSKAGFGLAIFMDRLEYVRLSEPSESANFEVGPFLIEARPKDVLTLALHHPEDMRVELCEVTLVRK